MDTELTPEQVEAKAREAGWTPQDQFKGDPSKWASAEEFLERAEKYMPLLRQTNRRLKDELATRDAKLTALQEQLDNATKTMERLEDHYTKANQQAAQRAIDNLKAELVEARETNDVDKEIALLEQIGIAQATVRRAAEENEDKEKKKDKKPNDPPQVNQHPDIVAWSEENDWYGKDKKRTRQFDRAAEDYREELDDAGTKVSPAEFLAEVSRRVGGSDGTEDQPPEKAGSSNRSTSNSSTSTVRGYSSLPKEARDACMADADLLVGEGKRYKTLADWQRDYVRIYNAS